jgi:hypothetical protein
MFVVRSFKVSASDTGDRCRYSIQDKKFNVLGDANLQTRTGSLIDCATYGTEIPSWSYPARRFNFHGCGVWRLFEAFFLLTVYFVDFPSHTGEKENYLVVASDVRSSGGVGLTSDDWRQSLVRPDTRPFFFWKKFHFLKKNENPHFFFSENRATRRQRRHVIGLPYTTVGIHRQNKHDRHTDSRLRLLEDNSPRDGRGS